MLLGDRRLWVSITHHKKITFSHATDLDSIQLQHIVYVKLLQIYGFVFQNWPEASNLFIFLNFFFFAA